MLLPGLRRVKEVVVLQVGVLAVLLRSTGLLLLGVVALVLLRVLVEVLVVVLGWVVRLLVVVCLRVVRLVEVPGLADVEIAVHADVAAVVGEIVGLVLAS